MVIARPLQIFFGVVVVAICLLVFSSTASAEVNGCPHRQQVHAHFNAVMTANLVNQYTKYTRQGRVHIHVYRVHYWYPIGGQGLTEYVRKACPLH